MQVIKANLNPEWNESIDLQGTLADFLATDLVLKVKGVTKRRRVVDRTSGLAAHGPNCQSPS